MACGHKKNTKVMTKLGADPLTKRARQSMRRLCDECAAEENGESTWLTPLT